MKSGLSSPQLAPRSRHPASSQPHYDAEPSTILLSLLVENIEPLANQQPSVQAAEKFAYHLMEHPESAGQAVAKLARDHGLPEPFVRDVLRQVRGSQKKSDAFQEVWADFSLKLKDMGEKLNAWLTKLTEDQTVFFVISTLAGVLLCTIFTVIGVGFSWAPVGSTGLTMAVGLGATVTICLVAILHLVAYFRSGMLSAAWVGIRWTLVLLTLTVVGACYFTLPRRFLVDGMRLVAVSGSIAVGAAFFYTILAVVASVLGGAAKMKEREARDDGLSRQEALERLMNVRERLDQLQALTPIAQPDKWHLAQAAIRRNLVPSSVSAIAVIGVLDVLTRTYAARIGLLAPFLQLLFVLLSMGIIVVASFFAGTVRKGILVALLLSLVASMVEMLPIGNFGLEHFAANLQSGNILWNLALGIGLGFIAGLGARIEDHAAQERRLREEDPAALVAEWIRLQWRIAPNRREICVMVVDAKASSQMKAQADPIVAEWTFREYQKFLEAISARWGGDVYATSGDGAVISFPSPNEAFAAARAIQREIDPFNRNVNRLRQNFRLRVGLHMGKLQGELEEVEFTEVVDIAAHVEAAAPVGGIAMTDRVANALEGESLAQVAEPIDGWHVFFALNPTGE